MNFVENEVLKMWILWKERFWKCEFCEKWDFENVNFVKNEIFKMWIFGLIGGILPQCELIIYWSGRRFSYKKIETKKCPFWTARWAERCSSTIICGAARPIFKVASEVRLESVLLTSDITRLLYLLTIRKFPGNWNTH